MTWDVKHDGLRRLSQSSILQGEHKKVAPPTTFVDISAMREDFCIKFYTTVKQSNMYFITKFDLNLLENDKLMLFQPRQPPISQHSEHYLHG